MDKTNSPERQGSQILGATGDAGGHIIAWGDDWEVSGATALLRQLAQHGDTTGAMADSVVIRGQRLLLRSLRPAEIEAEWQAMVTAGPIAVAELPDEVAFRARLARSGHLHDGWLDLAVDVDGESIGRIQTFVPPHRPLAPGTFDLGIGLRGEMRGKGYGREAVALLTDWLFEHANALLVEAGTDPENHAMRAVFRRAGWREDGTVTEIGRDWLMYRITRQQWQAAWGQTTAGTLS